MKKITLAPLVLALTILSLPAFAAEETAGDVLGGVFTKLGRGLYNIVSSPAELPCTMKKDISANGGSGAATGFGKGIAFMLRRILVGATETGTFMIPAEKTIPLVCKETL